MRIGDVSCTVSSVTATLINCNAGLSAAGSFPVQVQIKSLGYSNKNFNFDYNLQLASISNTQGSYAGGLELVLQGSGFAGLSTVVTICNSPCTVVSFNQFSSVTCKVSF